MIFRQHAGLMISLYYNNKGHIEQFDLQELKNISTQCFTENNGTVFSISNIFRIYVRCMFKLYNFILKLNHEGNTVKQFSLQLNLFRCCKQTERNNKL